MSLKSIPGSIGELKCLYELDFSGCSKLASLPDAICNLKSLIFFDVSGCVNLNGMPENMGNLESLKRLHANESGITKLPSSLNQLRQIEGLACSRCTNLVEIPDSICDLKSLIQSTNCINLDEGARRKIMDNVLAANLQVQVNCYGATLLIAGSEVPQRMRSYIVKMLPLTSSSNTAVLDVHSPDEEYLGAKLEPSWTEDPGIEAAFEKFNTKLKYLEGIIYERNRNHNKKRSGAGVVAYGLLKPFSKEREDNYVQGHETCSILDL
ncbi:hypothetical protein GH714_015438 [Hevea brasiliensis]|uniref:Lipoxygenase domain-containing protein n=1 Tax=Hevea brasiliensis TaxID=3981 RepID=A0A6A6N120_HEVBR|nr:hypothetical protein GH714_015438 [Hevea brasiliensis]